MFQDKDVYTRISGQVEAFLYSQGFSKVQTVPLEVRGSQDVAPPALLCHKDTAEGTQSLYKGHCLHFAVYLWYKGTLTNQSTVSSYLDQ